MIPVVHCLLPPPQRKGSLLPCVPRKCQAPSRHSGNACWLREWWLLRTLPVLTRSGSMNLPKPYLNLFILLCKRQWTNEISSVKHSWAPRREGREAKNFSGWTFYRRSLLTHAVSSPRVTCTAGQGENLAPCAFCHFSFNRQQQQEVRIRQWR